MVTRRAGDFGLESRLLGGLLVFGCSSSVPSDPHHGGEPAAPPEEVEPTANAIEREPEEQAPEARAPTPGADPGPPGSITFVYQRQRITACGMVEGDSGQKVCSATGHAEHHGNAEVVLLPIDEQGEEDPLRAEVVISFAEQPSSQTRDVELAKGFWELEWRGESTARDRFKVVSRDRYEISLQAIAGMCSLDGKKCILEAQKNQQVIELPEARGSD